MNALPLRKKLLWFPVIAASSALLAPVANAQSVPGVQKGTRNAIVNPVHEDGASVTRLDANTWLLAGGISDGHASDTIRIIRLVDGDETIRTLPVSLTHARTHHTATLLQDGSVFVFGGTGPDGSVLADAELIDPSVETVTDLGNAGLSARTGHTASLLDSGKVLLSGGVKSDGLQVATSQVFDPSIARRDVSRTVFRGNRGAATAAPVTGTLNLSWGNSNGYTTAVNTSTGQAAQLTFNAAAGEAIELDFSYNANPITLTVTNASGGVVWQSALPRVTSGTTKVTIPAIASQGAYTLTLDPGTIYHVGAQYMAGVIPSSSLSIGGQPALLAFAPYSASQRARFSFNGQSGQAFEMQLWPVSNMNGSAYSMDLYYMSGSNRTYVIPLSGGSVGSNYGMMIRSLPATTTYYVEFDGNSSMYMSLDAQLSNPLAGTLTANGPSLTVQGSPFYLMNFTASGVNSYSLAVTNAGTSTCSGLETQLIAPNGNVTLVKPDIINSSSFGFGKLSAGNYQIAALPANYAYMTTPYAAPNIYTYAWGGAAAVVPAIGMPTDPVTDTTSGVSCNYSLKSS